MRAAGADGTFGIGDGVAGVLTGETTDCNNNQFNDFMGEVFLNVRMETRKRSKTNHS